MTIFEWIERSIIERVIFNFALGIVQLSDILVETTEVILELVFWFANNLADWTTISVVGDHMFNFEMSSHVIASDNFGSAKETEKTILNRRHLVCHQVSQTIFWIQAYKKKIENAIDPLGWPSVTAGSDDCFCTCCPTLLFKFSQNKTKPKQCSLLARLWVWPSGSLTSPVLFGLF